MGRFILAGSRTDSANLKCDEQNIVIYIFKIFIENCGQLWLHNILCCISFS